MMTKKIVKKAVIKIKKKNHFEDAPNDYFQNYLKEKLLDMTGKYMTWKFQHQLVNENLNCCFDTSKNFKKTATRSLETEMHPTFDIRAYASAFNDLQLSEESFVSVSIE